MFDTLIESGDRRRAPAGSGAVSLAVHAGIVVLAVAATWNQQANHVTAPDPIAIELPEWPAPPDLPLPSGGSDGSPVPAPPAPDVPLAGVIAPIEVPLTVATDPAPATPRTLLQHMGDPRILVGQSQDPVGLESVHLSGEVDDPITITRQGVLRYPPALEAAGIPGRVTIEFVVDTLGIVEPGSLEIIETTHAAFVEAARTAILDTRFKPGTVRGRRVRQLARQSLAFRVNR